MLGGGGQFAEALQVVRHELGHKYILDFLRVLIIFSKEIFEPAVVFGEVGAGEHHLAYFSELPRGRTACAAAVCSQTGVPGTP